jgi:unsaturated chondroitin disaccharide hydrolase
MRKLVLPVILILIIQGTMSCTNSCPEPPPINQVVDEALEFSVQQGLLMARSLSDKPGQLPRTTDLYGNLVTCRSHWWVSGFFPGLLWYLYEHTGDEAIRQQADEFSGRVADQQYTNSNHDVGFMIFCSYGNGYRLTGDSDYLEVIRNAASSLSTRYNERVGAIRSWDWGNHWQYPVIIDNMMNLELMMWSSEKFDIPGYADLSVSHADISLREHYRPDFSSYHVVSFDTITGEAELKHTHQGYSHESAWARGQAWGLYGFTMMYRFTKAPAYLELAQNIADFIIHHPRMPADMIPYWDFDAPNIPDTYRDASAGAITCSALIELSRYVDDARAAEYMETAETQIRALSSPAYRNDLGNNGNFILKHGVGNLKGNSEVDVPLSYADYYYVEALLRLKNLLR